MHSLKRGLLTYLVVSFHIIYLLGQECRDGRLSARWKDSAEFHCPFNQVLAHTTTSPSGLFCFYHLTLDIIKQILHHIIDRGASPEAVRLSPWWIDSVEFLAPHILGNSPHNIKPSRAFLLPFLFLNLFKLVLITQILIMSPS